MKHMIRLSGVTKSFRLPRERRDTLREHFIGFMRPRAHDELVAAHDLSLEVGQGEFLGVVGANGSGKSTLLKLIAGIYPVHTGTIRVEGRIAPFLELGSGFQSELSGRDNVFLYAALLGLSRREAAERYDAIVAFAGLAGFMDQMVKNYSSGMQARLAFAISMHADADVLLVDEVLAVGDGEFQARCLASFERLKQEGKTVVFVSHDLDTIERFSDRVLWLERGKARMLGSAQETLASYREAQP
jgi:ABC-type polysaccharide/polyol phosphate transport system ATPase subunit